MTALAALLMVATFAKGLGNVENVTRSVESQLKLIRRVTFSVGGTHSDLEIASDGTAIYFIENVAEGMVLKRVSFNDGIPHIVARFESAFIGRVFSIPGDSERLIVAKLYGDAAAPWDLVFLSLTRREETQIDVGQEGSDGRVVMSPAGQLFGLGTRYQCVMVLDHRLCGVNAFSVFDAKNGKVVWSFPLPREKVSSQAWENSSPSDSRGEIFVARTVQKAGWLGDDALALGTSGAAPQFSWIELRRHSDGLWSESRLKTADVPERRQQLSPGDRVITLRRGKRKSRFRAGDFGAEWLICGGDRVVVGREVRVGWAIDRVEVSVFEWKNK